MSPYLFNGYEKLDLIENIMVMYHLVFVSMVFGFLEGGQQKVHAYGAHWPGRASWNPCIRQRQTHLH